MTRPRSTTAKLRGLSEFVSQLDLVQTVCLLTLVMVVIFGFDHWFFRIAAWSCLLMFVLCPRCLRRSGEARDTCCSTRN